MKKWTVSAVLLIAVFAACQTMAFAGSGQCCATGKVKTNFGPKNMKTAPAAAEVKAK